MMGKYFPKRVQRPCPLFQMADKIRNWMSELSEEKEALKAGLVMPVGFKQIFMDSTCIKANIHFPVD